MDILGLKFAPTVEVVGGEFPHLYHPTIDKNFPIPSSTLAIYKYVEELNTYLAM